MSRENRPDIRRMKLNMKKVLLLESEPGGRCRVQSCELL